LTGSSAISGTGNPLANTLVGNIANNILSGRAGADTMVGGAGNDIYVVDDAGDVVSELAGEGTDTVQSCITYTVGANVENLTLLGNNAIDATGSGLANTLVGNVGNNILDGGLGNDTLSGSGGINAFLFDTTLGPTNVDTIADFNVATDGIRLDKDIFTAFTTTGGLSASAFQTGAAAADATDRIIYNMLTGDLFYDSDGTGGTAQVQFAHVNGTPALTNANFQIVA
jgi:Ca2+-binding RTX toxin-like protein